MEGKRTKTLQERGRGAADMSCIHGTRPAIAPDKDGKEELWYRLQSPATVGTYGGRDISHARIEDRPTTSATGSVFIEAVQTRPAGLDLHTVNR